MEGAFPAWTTPRGAIFAMNGRAVCSQGRLASCRHCCAWRALLTLKPGAWPGTNICTEHSWALPVGHLGTWNSWALPGGHLGTWHSWALPVGHLGTWYQLGTAWGDTSRLPCLGNTVCHRAKGSGGDSVAVPAAVPGLLGHVGPNPGGAMCGDVPEAAQQ